MKRALLIGVILLVLSCDDQTIDTKTITDEYGITWGVMKSPITGKYYEVAQRNGLLSSKAGMVEISLFEYEKFINDN